MDVALWQVIVAFVVVLAAAVFSGFAGGGGSFVALPLFIALGLSPQQAIAVSKFSSFGMNIGATAVFKKRAFEHPKLLLGFVVMAFVISLFVPLIFNKLDSHIFQTIIGVIILLMIPIMLYKRHGLVRRKTTKLQKVVGGGLMAGVLGLQGVFSGGVNSLQSVVLVSLFGFTALQAAAMKRIISLALNTFVVIALVVATDYMVWELAVAAAIASFIGGYIGSHIAVRKGEGFARYALIGIMLVSGTALIIF